MATTTRELSHQDRCRGHYQLPGLEIQVGETQTLIPMQRRKCPSAYVFKLANGELIAGGPRSTDPLPTWRRSSDGGQTWRDAPAWPTYNAYQFPDGEIIHLAHHERPWLDFADEEGTYSSVMYRSRDNGYTHVAETALLLDVPGLAERQDRAGQPCAYAYIDHKIVALPDGSLLASVQGRFARDRKWRSFVVRSEDRGRTWRYLSTVAADLTEGEKPRIEGFCEPDLLVLPSGEILCFMRTGGKYDNRYTPLYLSRSLDGGRSWSNADPIADRGVFPNSCLTASGVIAVIYGRPGHWLAFSADDGHTWMGHFCLHQGANPYDCGGYDWLLEMEADTLLAIYGYTDPNDCWQSAILGTYISVKRT